MMILLNATVTIFGRVIDWDADKTAVWLIVAQVLLILAVVGGIIYFILKPKKSKNNSVGSNVTTSAQTSALQQAEAVYVADTQVVDTYGEQAQAAPQPIQNQTDPDTGIERVLQGISLDLGAVKREFTAGDQFNCMGLVVFAEYNVSPTRESFGDFTLTDVDTYNRLKKRNKLSGVYVIKPYMYIAGVKIITVKMGDFTSEYTIMVKERVARVVEMNEPLMVEQEEPVVAFSEQPTVDETPVVAEQPSAEQPIVVQETVEEKPRELMSISINTDNVQKEYVVGESINTDGLVVVAHYNIEPLEEQIDDYTVVAPDMNKKGRPTVSVTYQDKTVGYKITVKSAPKPAVEPTWVQEGIFEDAPITTNESTEQVVVEQSYIVEEETMSSRLRYDKSFTARMIQSRDEVKYWYTALKNEILSYKGVKGRISWKRETFKCGGKLVLVKLAYRGNILCVYLPLKVTDFPEGYPVEDASDMGCYEDSPLMIRLKNNKRVELAKELIRMVMEQNNMVRVEHEAVDYYMPYEGILDLINKGLVRRNIRSAEDEAIFDRDSVNVAPPNSVREVDARTLTQVAPGIYVTTKE